MSQALVNNEARRRRLGELLVMRGLLADEDVASALAEQRRTKQRLGQILLDPRPNLEPPQQSEPAGGLPYAPPALCSAA